MTTPTVDFTQSMVGVKEGKDGPSGSVGNTKQLVRRQIKRPETNIDLINCFMIL
jgi:hypothetical protein